MQPIRLAVVGAGKLGGYHANLAASLPDFALIAIADPHQTACVELARKHNARPTPDYNAVLSEIDAVVVATPTSTHAAVVEPLLRAGKHVLVEKPIAPNAADATAMVDAAKQSNRVLQVGHVERFNPAFSVAGEAVREPRYLQATRTSGYTFRSTDIGAVLDLMIHDIDLVLELADSPVVDVTAFGARVIGKHEDMVNARLTFANGCIADLTASRVSYELKRTMQVFTDRGYTRLDFAAGTATTVQPTAEVLRGEFDGDALSDERKQELFRGKLFEEVLIKTDRQAPAINAIEAELKDFARAIRTGTAPRVPGAAGRDAVAIAERIIASVAAGQERTATLPLRKSA